MSGEYFNIGSFHRRISTDSPETQLWFDRGLTWCYGFNHGEGLKCFEAALKTDETCAMAYWGIAYALGPNYNKAWRLFDPKNLEECIAKAHKAIHHAHTLAAQTETTLVERALINALQARSPDASPPPDLTVWGQAYADAMKAVYEEYPDDLDVATLAADALMCLTPWALWNIYTGQPNPGSRVLEAKAIFDHAFAVKSSYSHPGLLHMFIHFIEMSSTPEAGLKAADRLRGLCPDVGHFNHMPTHLDVLVGDYRRAIASNESAIRADNAISARYGIMNFYSLYRMHTYQSLIYAAMLAGQSEVALDSCDKMESSLPDALLRIESPPMADWLEVFRAVRLHVLIRFGRWQDIIKLDLPQDQQLYCATTAMLHYAKALAYAATRQLDPADAERSLFQAAVERVAPTRLAFPNKYLDIFAIARAMLDGELEYRRGNFDSAWRHLREAVQLDDHLVYAEPWGWMLPTRHPFGALLLEQGRVEEALVLYAADLGFDATLPPGHRHPNNVFALHGYHECLLRLGRSAEAKLLEQELQLRMAVADVAVKSSCFCRLGTESKPNGANGSSQ